MNDRVDHLLLQALALAPDDRERFAAALLESLESSAQSEPQVNTDGLQELKHRAAEHDAGRDTEMSLDEFREWIKA